MGKSTPSFVAEFELATASKSSAELDKKLNAYRQLYNATLGVLKSNLAAAKASPEWHNARQLPHGSAQRKEAFKAVRKQYHLSSAEAQRIAAGYRQGHLEALTNSRVVQQIAKRAYRAIEKVMFGKAKRVRFRRRDEFFSFEGNDQKTGVIVHKSTTSVRVDNLDLLFKAELTNPYHLHALNSRVKYARIIKKVIAGRVRWYLQMILEGIPYQNPEHKTKAGNHIGLDLGPSLIAVSTAQDSFEQQFCGAIDKQEQKIRQLQRAMERSRRNNNPDNYDERGCIKKGAKKWHHSNNYNKLRIELGELQRKKAAHRKSLHGQLANEIISLGNEIHTEKVSYRAWQKRYGKSISHHAPSAQISILTRKAEMLGGGVLQISTYHTALSQHCICGDKQRKPLSERIHNCRNCGFSAPRDQLSAYLAMHTSLIKGEWKTDFEAAFSGIERHRTLSLGWELKPIPGALYQGNVSSGESATEGLIVLKRRSRYVRALRT